MAWFGLHGTGGPAGDYALSMAWFPQGSTGGYGFGTSVEPRSKVAA
jgi:hypothetical protein